jgi:predicted alpha/beta superfamily hydrolase
VRNELFICLVIACAHPRMARVDAPPAVLSLAFGETFHLDSKVLGERRTINVYLPPDYARDTASYPILVMPDGGLAEDFLHVAGDVDVSIRNDVIRPVIVVGIENTERRRDLVGPTEVEDERTAAPHAGGADRFREFLRIELLPYIAAHYRTSGESALIGESLAGLFVIETMLVEPDLFDAYIAIDPSVWWNDESLVSGAGERFAAWTAKPKHLVVATSEEPSTQLPVARLLNAIDIHRPPGLSYDYLPLPEEHHSTIYPIAGVRAIRLVFAHFASRTTSAR